MFRGRLFLSAAATIAAVCALTLHADAAKYTHAWAHPGSDNVEVYMTIENDGEKALFLTGAKSPIARSVEMHRSFEVTTGVDDASAAITSQTVGSIVIEPHQHIDFTPGGYRFTLVHMRGKLRSGQHFPLILLFHNKAREVVSVRVTDR